MMFAGAPSDIPPDTVNHTDPWWPEDDDHGVPNIADQFADLLKFLTPKQRSGMIVRLSVGFYDGWRPCRGEFSDLVAAELGILTWERAATRHHLRTMGQEPASMTPAIRAWHREQQRVKREALCRTHRATY